MPDIVLRNSLTQRKEILNPLEPSKIRMYACGVTVYDDCHIGHAMQAIYFDVIRRYLMFKGFDVTYVRNYTDVDDKIIARAKLKNMDPGALADAMILSCQEDMTALSILPADQEPRVRDCIPDIVQMVQTLIENGAAYATAQGDVYYRVNQKSDYGKLSHRKPDELLSGTRDLVGREKEDSLDFALWKGDTTEGASWDSPWGRGRPGWHIECSAMAKKCLGDTIDIHGGGRDLIFPHHENELAQSESANKKEFARCWIHSGLLTVERQKMSKSLGNSILIKDFLKDFDGEVLRLAYLLNHYASAVDFSRRVFLEARKRLFSIYETLKRLDESASRNDFAANTQDEMVLSAFEKNFDEAMCDDINTPKALAEVSVLVRWANRYLANPKASGPLMRQAAVLLRKYLQPLGLFQQDPQAFLESQKEKILLDLGITETEILQAMSSRKKARESKDWAQSDEIRNSLLQRGIELRDTGNGSDWGIAT